MKNGQCPTEMLTPKILQSVSISLDGVQKVKMLFVLTIASGIILDLDDLIGKTRKNAIKNWTTDYFHQR